MPEDPALPESGEPTSRRVYIVAILAAVVVAIAATWPVALHLSDHVVDGAGGTDIDVPSQLNWHAVNFAADVLQTVWIVNWEIHALATQPLHLFDANIGYPAALSLARADHMLGTSLLGLPGALFGGPIFVHQTALILCGILNFLAAAWVVARWTNSNTGALVAGVIFTVSAYQVGRLFHLQALSAAYFPLMLFTLERFAATGRKRWAFWGSGALALQILAGSYMAYWALSAWCAAAAVVLIARQVEKRSPIGLARDVGLLISATLAGVLASLPVVLPYLRVMQEGNLPDSTRMVNGVRRMQDYFAGPPHIEAAPILWLLAALGVFVLARGSRDGRVRLAILLLVGLTGFVISMGAPPGGFEIYTLVGDIVPGFSTIRDPVRAAILVHTVLALLAGCGMANVTRWIGRPGIAVAAIVLAIYAMSDHGVPVPLRKLPVENILPPGYHFLARCGAGDPLVELPADLSMMSYVEAERMYFSTYHWLPLLNGRVSYRPPQMNKALHLSRAIPNPGALEKLRSLTGLRWIRVDCDAPRWMPGVAELLCEQSRIPGALRYDLGSVVLYDLSPAESLPRSWPRRWEPPLDCRDGPKR